VSVVFYQVEVSVMSQSLIHWIPTECRCYWVWSWSLNSEEALAYWGCQAIKRILPLVDYLSDLHLNLPLIKRLLPLSLSVIECVVIPVGMCRSLSSNDLWWWKQWGQ